MVAQNQGERSYLQSKFLQFVCEKSEGRKQNAELVFESCSYDRNLSTVEGKDRMEYKQVNVAVTGGQRPAS
jgi:hypothetical protein